MGRLLRSCALLLTVLLMCGSTAAVAESVISTTVVMRVSHTTQSAVVNAGEDLSMEVNIEGVQPHSYQWYYEGAPIAGATFQVYIIENARVEDSGVYQMKAFDENGTMLVSTDISARVIDATVPKSGDASMPIQVFAALFLLSAGGLIWLLGRKRMA